MLDIKRVEGEEKEEGELRCSMSICSLTSINIYLNSEQSALSDPHLDFNRWVAA